MNLKCNMCDKKATQHLIVKKGLKRVREFDLCMFHFEYQLYREQLLVPYGYRLKKYLNIGQVEK